MEAKIEKRSELSKLLSVKTRMSDDLFHLFGKFGIGHLLSHLSLEKLDEVSALELILSLCLFRIVGESFNRICKHKIYELSNHGKNCFYRMMIRPQMDWRRLMNHFALRYMCLLRKYGEAPQSDTTTCFIIDDTVLEKKRNKLQEYDQHLEIMEERNSYSKTDPDATFMHMKEDAMRNGQTKPGYNLQIATENQFITDFALYANRTDTLTLPSFLESFKSRYHRYAKTVIADSGYGSEENYLFMDVHNMEAYVKYNYFHKEQRPRYTPNPFSPASLYYNKEQDFYVCPMGQHMKRIGMKRSITSNGFVTYSVRYQAERCDGCPLRGSCFKARGNRIIEVNHQLQHYKQKARD